MEESIVLRSDFDRLRAVYSEVCTERDKFEFENMALVEELNHFAHLKENIDKIQKAHTQDLESIKIDCDHRIELYKNKYLEEKRLLERQTSVTESLQAELSAIADNHKQEFSELQEKFQSELEATFKTTQNLKTKIAIFDKEKKTFEDQIESLQEKIVESLRDIADMKKKERVMREELLQVVREEDIGMKLYHFIRDLKTSYREIVVEFSNHIISTNESLRLETKKVFMAS